MQSLDISTFEIIGYSDVLPQGCLPSIVPPIFRAIGSESVLVPPYTFNNQQLCGATKISFDELKSLEHRQEVTLFPVPFRACNGFVLWIDCEGQWHYQYGLKVMGQISSEQLGKSSSSFFQLAV